MLAEAPSQAVAGSRRDTALATAVEEKIVSTAKKTAPEPEPTIDLDVILAEKQGKAPSRIRVRLFGQEFDLLPLTQIDLRAFSAGLTEAEQALSVMESMFGDEQLARVPAGSLTADVAGGLIEALAAAQMETAPLEPSESTGG